MKLLPVLVASFFVLCITLFTPSQTFAQNSTAPLLPQASANLNSDVPSNLNTYTQSVVLELLGAATCQLAGLNVITKDNKCLGFDQRTGKLGYVESNGGAVGFMGGLIGMTFSLPVSTSQYVAYMGNNFGLTQKANAQTTGTGFNSLGPVVKVWSAFRNITYLLLVAVFLFIGLGIMFRFNLDGKTAMTIQNQIPKIIIALILITFSYAIAGLLIDVMWISTYVGARIIVNADTTPPGQPALNYQTQVIDQLQQPPIGFANEALKTPGTGPGGIIGLAFTTGAGIQSLLSNLFAPNLSTIFRPLTASQQGQSFFSCMQSTAPLLLVPIIGIPTGITFGFDCWVKGAITNTVGETLAQIFGWLVSFIVGVVAFLVIVIAIIAALFRLWFSLLKAYVFILLDVVLAPFWILTGLFPGGKGITGWLRDIIANLSAFPVVVFMFLFARVFVDSFGTGPISNQFIPPLIGVPGGQNVIGGFIALGIILITPEVVTMTRDFFQAPASKYMGAVGAGVGVGQAMLGGAAGAIGSRLIYTTRTGAIAGPVGMAFRGQRWWQKAVQAGLRANQGGGESKPQS